MILVVIEDIATARNLLWSAAKLALQLDMKLTISIKQQNINSGKSIKNIISEIINKPAKIIVYENETASILELCEKFEALFLFIQISEKKHSVIQKNLNKCRELRIPYIFYFNHFDVLDLQKVIVPVSFLEEELEKAQFASAFGRFCSSHIVLLPAADYGSKAASTTSKMIELFSKFNLSWEIIKAGKDSFKVDNEALTIAGNTGAGLILVSASRDYGLDDIIFGPKELHLIKKSKIPVLLVNPRGDLYALCD